MAVEKKVGAGSRPPSPQVESPCNGECIIDQDTGYCQGCARTMTEIRKWLSFSERQREEVYRLLEPRRAGLVGPADD
ncbi:MAG: DUF1289 domain-containing protein [Pseudomonadota bacterium]